ncbi:MAG: transposase [Actinobacteria bacterium]|nr:transposase [Actinomycetota bacterium]
MKYFPEEAKVTYKSKYSKEEKEFSSLERMAALCSHIPEQGEQMLRYYGYYSNVIRGRLKEVENGLDCCIIPEGEHAKHSNKSLSKAYQKYL